MNAEDNCTTAIILPTSTSLRLHVAAWPRADIERRLIMMVDMFYYRSEDDTYDIGHGLMSMALDEHAKYGGILRSIQSDLTTLYDIVARDVANVGESVHDFMEWSEVADGHASYSPQRWVLWVDPYDY